MVWLMGKNVENLENVLTGPAVGAALGVRAWNRPTDLLIAVPNATPAGAQRLLRLLDPEGHLWTNRREPALQWFAQPIISDRQCWTLQGDPRKWVADCDPALLYDRVVTLANGNPSVYADLLEKASLRWSAIDIDGRWSPSQPAALNRCLRRVNLVTITRRDYEQVHGHVFAGTKIGQSGGAAVVIKAGADGIIVKAEGETRLLPAPASEKVTNDVGAGDFLLGLLTARLGSCCSPCSVAEIESAYRDALPLLARLLESDGFTSFAHALLEAPYGN
jgi:hypothetical protein